MSRIGKLPIPIPPGVKVEMKKNAIKVKGPKGELFRELHPNIKVEMTNETIIASRPSDSRINKSLHGLTRTLINNMVIGVTNGYKKVLQINGVGYRSMLGPKSLSLYLGFSKPVEYPIPKGIEFEVTKANEIIVKGINKELVGQIAAEIRSLRPPEPYKGKGIKYDYERIIKKAGKAAAGAKT
jgi:large subunit ribosomal protein L6